MSSDESTITISDCGHVPDGWCMRCVSEYVTGRQKDIADIRRAEQNLSNAIRNILTLRPASEWHDDHQDVLWFHLPLQEAPYVGSPLDCNWEEGVPEGWYTHWIPCPDPVHTYYTPTHWKEL